MNAALAGARAPNDTVSRSASRRSGGRGAPRRRIASGSIVALLGIAVAAGAPPLAAQDAEAEPDRREMTVEELERFVAEQKAALEEVRRNRDVTAEKAREVRVELDEREARRRETEAELEALCQERESLEPGSYEDCVAPLAER